jgi:hypothetical protein
MFPGCRMIGEDQPATEGEAYKPSGERFLAYIIPDNRQRDRRWKRIRPQARLSEPAYRATGGTREVSPVFEDLGLELANDADGVEHVGGVALGELDVRGVHEVGGEGGVVGAPGAVGEEPPLLLRSGPVAARGTARRKTRPDR